MLQMKTIENLIKNFNEENNCNAQLTYSKFDYWDNVLSVELNEKTMALAKHEINKKHKCSVLNQDLSKREIIEILELLIS